MFRVESVLQGKTVHVIVRQLQQVPFAILKGSELGTCKLKQSIGQPRALKSDGSPDFDLFVFYLADGNDKNRIVAGREYELTSN